MSGRGVAYAWGEMQGGKLVLQDRPDFDSQVKALPDGPVRVKVAHTKADSEFRQMQKYWHAVPVEICRQKFGLQHDPMHYALLGECWGHEDTPFGPMPIVVRSSRLSRAQWVQMLDWVLDWGPSEHGLIIPEPQSPKAKTLTAEYYRASQEVVA